MNVYIGIDWSESKHDVLFMNVHGEAVCHVVIPHKVEGFVQFERKRTPRPRVKGKRSIARKSNERWAMDVTHIDCGVDGLGHLIAIVDCYDREFIGFEFALRGRAKEADRALEEACIARFGTLYPQGERPQLRSDNGLIFQSRRFCRTCGADGLRQEFITPYTPQQNGLIERFFRSLKEESVWVSAFRSFAEAKRTIEVWRSWHNHERPHQVLAHRSPIEFRQRQQLSWAA